MAKKQQETANDVVFLLDGETITGERLDVASIFMLRAFSVAYGVLLNNAGTGRPWLSSSWIGGNRKGKVSSHDVPARKGMGWGGTLEDRG